MLRADHELFERIVSAARPTRMAAMLRGELLADGDPELLIATRQLLPTSPAPSMAIRVDQGGQS